MPEEQQTEVQDEKSTALQPAVPSIDTTKLNTESLELIHQIITETDIEKTKDLTYLFNANQNKKTIIRQNKLNELQDILVDQAMERFSARPEEISNKELFDGLKTVQDMIERGQKQVNGVSEAPLIQINQQNNEVNMQADPSNLPKESRDRIRSAIMGVLGSINGIPSTKLTDDAIININKEENQTE